MVENRLFRCPWCGRPRDGRKMFATSGVYRTRCGECGKPVVLRVSVETHVEVDVAECRASAERMGL